VPQTRPIGGVAVSFLTDTALQRAGDGRFTARLDPNWASMLGIHGGYVAAVAASAIERWIDEPARALRSLTTQFLRPPSAGEAVITVETVTAGHSMTFTRATVHQNDKAVLVATATAGHTRGGLEFDELPRATSDRPGPQGPGAASRFTGAELSPHLAQLDLRLEPGVTLFSGTGVARMAGWVRPLDADERVTIPWLVCAADFMPPSMVTRTDRPVQAASIDYSIQFLCAEPASAVPAGGFVHGEMRCSISAEGFSVEDGTFRSPDGRVLATSRQLRLAGT
jgi:acyl-CoA thioesterase